MGTIFKVSVMLLSVLMIGGLAVSFFGSYNVLPVVGDPGISGVNESNFLQDFTTLKYESDGSKVQITDTSEFWVMLVGGLGGSLFLVWLTRSVIPLGLYVYGAVFYTIWMRSRFLLATGGLIETQILTMIDIMVILVFVGGSTGILTGGG